MTGDILPCYDCAQGSQQECELSFRRSAVDSVLGCQAAQRLDAAMAKQWANMGSLEDDGNPVWAAFEKIKAQIEVWKASFCFWKLLGTKLQNHRVTNQQHYKLRSFFLCFDSGWHVQTPSGSSSRKLEATTSEAQNFTRT